MPPISSLNIGTGTSCYWKTGYIALFVVYAFYIAPYFLLWILSLFIGAHPFPTRTTSDPWGLFFLLWTIKLAIPVVPFRRYTAPPDRRTERAGTREGKAQAPVLAPSVSRKCRSVAWWSNPIFQTVLFLKQGFYTSSFKWGNTANYSVPQF